MSKILYCPPFGDDVESPDIDKIKNIIFTESQDYWREGSGDSGIEIQGKDDRMLFFNYRDIGFFIMLSPDYEVPISKSNNDEIKTFSHRIGGNEFSFPSCCLFAKEDAWNIIEHFLKTGDKLSEFKWIDLYEIDFEYEL